MEFNRNGIVLHLILQVGNKQSNFKDEYRKEIFETIRTLMQGIGENMRPSGKMFAVKGYRDHVHIVFSMPPELSFLVMICEIKKQTAEKFNESNWFDGKFIWHRHYAVYSMSFGFGRDEEMELIYRQEEYHKHISFKDELSSAMRTYIFRISDKIREKMRLSFFSFNKIQNLDITNFVNIKKNENISESQDTDNTKSVYYNNEYKKLNILSYLLEKKCFTKVQKTLDNKHISKGINTLFYGTLETKTEIVYQIAKETNRDVMKFDISLLKLLSPKEVEAKINEILAYYYQYSNLCETMPILLFNWLNTINPVTLREEIIQDIILEELKHFRGIFFATTNIANNLSPILKENFLFKIEF